MPFVKFVTLEMQDNDTLNECLILVYEPKLIKNPVNHHEKR